MHRTLVNMNPSVEARTIEEVFDRLFGSQTRPNGTPTTTLPIDIFEQDGNLIVKAAVPGISPEELEIQIENNVLTIRGESHAESATEDQKVYRREVSYGAFARSVRLPDNLNLEQVGADFKNGIVTISLPRVPEEKPKTLKIPVRTPETQPTPEA